MVVEILVDVVELVVYYFLYFGDEYVYVVCLSVIVEDLLYVLFVG